MRVIGFDEPGGPEVLRAFELPEPPVGPGQVRIRVRAAAVNPSDVVTRSGLVHDRYAAVNPPYVPGWDAAGTVDEADPDTGWRAGAEVVAITLPVLDGGGAYAEKIVVPAESVAALPAGRDFASAATLPMNGLTAWQALDRLALEPGAVLVVTGAAGAVGGYAVELAKHAGLQVIADAAPADRDLVRALGADTVVDRGSETVAQIRAHYPEGVDAVIDGALLRDDITPVIRSGGAYAALRPERLGGGIASRPGLTVHEVMVGSDIREKSRLDRLSELAASGALSLRVADLLPAEQASEAHRRLERGGIRGRIVLEF
ncbi:quinone oxidoreductase family protein [Nocardia sp. NPDC003963]